MDILIHNTLRRVLAEKDEVKRAELMATSNEELGRHFAMNKLDAEELAFSLFNMAFKDVMKDDLLPKLVEVRTKGFNEPDYIEEDIRGLRIYSQGKGGQILSSVLRYGRQIMPRDGLVGAIDWHVDEMKTNFWGEFSKLTAQIREKIRQAPLHTILELWRAAVTNGHDAYGEFAKSSLTDAQVDSVVDVVADASDGAVSIVGTNQGVRYLSKVGLEFGDGIKEDIFKTGVIGVYKGRPVIQVENFEDFKGQRVLRNDELAVIGQRAGRVVWYGTEAKVQQLDREGFYKRWETERDWGCLLYGAEKNRIGRVKLT